MTLVILDLISDFGSDVLEVGWQRTRIGVLVLQKLSVAGKLGVVLLSSLLCLGRARR